MRYEQKIGQWILVVHCGQDLAVQARALLEKLEGLSRTPPGIHEGTTIQFGWSRFRLEAHGMDLVVCEPDFSGDPFHNTVPEVDRSLRVLSEQVAVCKLVSAVGPDVRFDQTIIADKSHIGSSPIFAERRKPDPPEFSGWFVGSFEREIKLLDENKLEILYVYQLLTLRREVLRVLCLPENYFVVLSDGRIDTIFAGGGIQKWPPPAANKTDDDE